MRTPEAGRPIAQVRNITTPFQEDLGKIDILQKTFNNSLGIEKKQGETIRSYNPVLARWKFEQLHSEKDKTDFQRYEVFQMQTNLRERYHAAKSAVTYTFDESGNAYNELFPDEPFVKVLERGIAYRQKEGSPELERELEELRGFLTVQKKLGDPSTPLGTKFISISSPGIVEDTTYKDNFVDIYELVKDSQTGKRSIKMTRHASDMKYREYYDVALQLDPHYFSGVSGPIDAWFLGKPFLIDPQKDKRNSDELFTDLFRRQEGSTMEEDFDLIYKACLPLVLYYVDALCKDPFNPEEVALAFNAILHKGDTTKKSLHTERQGMLSVASNASDISRTGNIFSTIQQEVAFRGRQKIEDVAVGCGSSGGFVFGNPAGNTADAVGSFLSNSIAKFGVKQAISFNPFKFVSEKKDEKKEVRLGDGDEYGALEFKCPHCNHLNRRPKGELIELCQNDDCTEKESVAC